ncbi:hypothetical protein ACFW08_08055 [Streptomyces sp. NPDC058960]|uniref:hypothetical protein n=1 Tax=Streptomyces sp. NPDC058960 TaxID=3346679 RepID=UPI00369D74D8
MDLQGIGAISAAMVAALGIPAALLVGRWQLRGAIQAAEEASRSGIMQAEATYRAALDAVRTEANNAHSQWRRGIRRDAYASFLVATTRVVQVSSALPKETLNNPEEVRAAKAAVREAQNELNACYWVVKLEGPGSAAEAAGNVFTLILALVEAFDKNANVQRVKGTLGDLAENSTNERVRDAASSMQTAVISLGRAVRRHGYIRHSGPAPEQVANAESEVRGQFRHLQSELGTANCILLLQSAYRQLPDPVAADAEANDAIQIFIAEAQRALDLPLSPSV